MFGSNRPGQMSNRELSTSPVFIVGNRRSGTTMLRLMLSCHPKIGIPPEGGFAVILGWKYESESFEHDDTRCRFAKDFMKIDSSIDWAFTETELIAILDDSEPTSYADALRTIYTSYLGRVYPGKVRWGDKTTWFADHIQQLFAYFPNAQFIHLVRDGRDVAVSYRGVPHLTNQIRKIARDWAINYEKVIAASKKIGQGQIYRLYYEYLVENPELQLKKLCDFLGEEYSPEMLDFWRVNRERELEPARHMRWKMKTTMPVTAKSVGRWKKELTAIEIADFELVAGHVLVRLGYELSIQPMRVLASIRRCQLVVFMVFERFLQFVRCMKVRYL